MLVNRCRTGTKSQVRAAELALLNAPFGPGGWDEAIHAAAIACGGRGANLVRLGGSLPTLNIITGQDADRAHRYLACPDLWGPENWRVGSAQQAMAVSFDSHYQSYRAAIATSTYDDAALDLDMEFGCQAVLAEDGAGFVGLAIIRGRREGRCNPDAVATFKRLVVTAERAVRAERALGGEAAELASGQLARLCVPTMLTDGHGIVQAMSPAAEAVVISGRVARMRFSSLSLVDPEEDLRFQAALGALLRFDQRRGCTTELAFPDGRRIGLVHRPPVHGGLGFEPQLSLTLFGDWI